MNIQFNKTTRKILAAGTPLAAPVDSNVDSMEMTDQTQLDKLNQPGEKTISADGQTITVTAPSAPSAIPIVPGITPTERSKLNALGAQMATWGSAAIPLIALGASVDVTIPFFTTQPDNNYTPQFLKVAGAVNLANLEWPPTVKTKNNNNIVVTLKNTGLIGISVGASIEVSIYRNL